MHKAEQQADGRYCDGEQFASAALSCSRHPEIDSLRPGVGAFFADAGVAAADESRIDAQSSAASCVRGAPDAEVQATESERQFFSSEEWAIKALADCVDAVEPIAELPPLFGVPDLEISLDDL